MTDAVSLRRIQLIVEGEPPVRTIPGRSADRHSPNAAPLAEAAQRLVMDDPTGFPIAYLFNIILRSGETVPETVGYDIEDPILEVLVDVGVLLDERLQDSASYSRDPRRDDYEVTIEPA